jgi:hypothetical protein
MATSWGDKEYIWSNVFAYLNANDVGKCTTMSSLMNKCDKRHFQQVPTTVQVVQPNSWGKARLEPPFDGNQGDNGVGYLSREKTFSHSLIRSRDHLSRIASRTTKWMRFPNL